MSHFFICGRLSERQIVGLLFRAEDVGVNRFFAVAQDYTGEGGKYNQKRVEEEMKMLEEELGKVEQEWSA